MHQDPLPTRLRILRAADAIATENGAGMVSLDAVAERAGISKGGLLYHFPSKGRLLQALVENHLDRVEGMLAEHDDQAAQNCVILTLLDHFLAELERTPPEGGLLAALAEDPAILAPVAAFQERVLRRIRANTSDPVLAETIFFAIQGWHHGRLLGLYVPDPPVIAALAKELRKRLMRG